jgi:VIT1/CCC1 family predicted Fe2+/Mn2+ transporter
VDDAANGDGPLPRESLHVEPRGLRDIARHYLKDMVYGAHDGVITTFAVVAGVEGGALTQRAVLIVGFATLLADGLSMAAGSYLSIRSSESVRRALHLPEEEASPVRHGLATFMAFATAGFVPLAPYCLPAFSVSRPIAALIATFGALFGIGALRSAVTDDPWLGSGLEMLGLGMAVAGVAYTAGLVIGRLAGS